MNEIAAAPSALTTPDESSQPGSLLNFVAMALKDPGIQVDKLDALLRMQREVQADAARREYAVAMNLAQADIQPVVRRAENLQTRSLYAKLEHVDEAIRPVYIKHGFSLSFDEETAPDGLMVVVCYVRHAGGHTERHQKRAPADTHGPKGTQVKTELHGRGSTTTFLRRYITCDVFNVVFRNVDDDGNRGGMAFITVQQQQQITKLIAETKADLSGFLDYLGADAIENIEAKKYGMAVNALEAKKRQLAAKGSEDGKGA